HAAATAHRRRRGGAFRQTARTAPRDLVTRLSGKRATAGGRCRSRSVHGDDAARQARDREPHLGFPRLRAAAALYRRALRRHPAFSARLRADPVRGRTIDALAARRLAALAGRLANRTAASEKT